MKTTFFPLLGLLLWNSTIAQERSLFATLEILGNGSYISANYDARFARQNKGLGFRAGLGSTLEAIDQPTLSLPVGINYLWGGDQHFVEAGLMAIPERNRHNSYGQQFEFRTRANLGYRYVSKKGVMFNVLWTPQLTVNNEFERRSGDGTKLLWFGLGAGIRL